MIAFTIILTLLMLLVIFFDVTKYIIPNWLNAIVLVMYPLFIWLSPAPVDWANGLYALGTMFAVGMLMFMLRIMGGGDIKLFIVLSPWCGLGRPFLDMLVFTALYGGALSIFLLFSRPIIAGFYKTARKGKKPPRVFTLREPVPYGLAISASVITMLWLGKMPLVPSLASIVGLK